LVVPRIAFEGAHLNTVVRLQLSQPDRHSRPLTWSCRYSFAEAISAHALISSLIEILQKFLPAELQSHQDQTIRIAERLAPIEKERAPALNKVLTFNSPILKALGTLAN
jgi:hypothetical protein